MISDEPEIYDRRCHFCGAGSGRPCIDFNGHTRAEFHFSRYLGHRSGPTQQQVIAYMDARTR